MKKRLIQKKDQSSKQRANKEPTTSTSTVQKLTNNTTVLQGIPEYNTASSNNNTNSIINVPTQQQNKSPEHSNQDAGYYSGSSYDDDPRKTTNAQFTELGSVIKKHNVHRSNQEEKQNEEDTENEEDLNNVGEINDTVESSSVDTSTEDIKKKAKKGEYQSLLSPNVKSSLQWWVRNPLFQQIKIIDESHLDTNGPIIQEALDKIKIDKSSKYFNACVNEIRRITGYVFSPWLCKA